MTPTKLFALLASTCLLGGCDRAQRPSAPMADVAITATPAAPANAPRVFIDAHAHLNSYSYGLLNRYAGSVGLRRVINLSGGSTPERRANNLAAADKWNDTVLLFHNVDWDGIDDPNFAEREAGRLSESVRAGFAGVKISKALGLGVTTSDGELLTVDDPRLDPLWRRAGELGVPIAIHTSDPKAFFEKPGPQNERHAELSLAPSWSFYGDEFPSRQELLAARDRMVAKHPGTTFILVHLGNNPEDPDYIAQLLDRLPNAYVDISARVGEFGRHDASKMKAFFEKYAGRVMFATDIQLSVRPLADGRAQLRLTLGSIGDPPPELSDISRFYQRHFDYFETSGAPIDHPVPIQGDWKVHPVGISSAARDAIYFGTAERVVVAPWLGRKSAHRTATRAQQIVSGLETP